MIFASCSDILASIAAMASLIVLLTFLFHFTVPDNADWVKFDNSASVGLRSVCLVAEIARSSKEPAASFPQPLHQLFFFCYLTHNFSPSAAFSVTPN